MAYTKPAAPPTLHTTDAKPAVLQSQPSPLHLATDDGDIIVFSEGNSIALEDDRTKGIVYVKDNKPKTGYNRV